jgi:hypothetical protein
MKNVRKQRKILKAPNSQTNGSIDRSCFAYKTAFPSYRLHQTKKCLDGGGRSPVIRWLETGTGTKPSGDKY